MKKYFCGWYYRCQSDSQTLAIIPSVHKTSDNTFCNLQIITETDALQATFPYSDLSRNSREVCIGRKRFSKDGITLENQTPELQVSGALRFGVFTPIKYDNVGSFRYIPFLQCRHSFFSMKHTVNGEWMVNGICCRFADSAGYLEGTGAVHFPENIPGTSASFRRDL